MRIGIDLGGTKIEGIVVDPQGHTVLKRRVTTPVAAGYKAIIEAIAALVTNLEGDAGGSCSVGLATPGALSKRTGKMKNCNATCINGEALGVDLEHLLKRKVRLANDADCFALSEARDGAAAGYEVVFGIILGTGVGGGLVFNNHVHSGPNAIAGEWGHTPLLADGPKCYCGKQGCVETLLSGPGLLRDYRANDGTLAKNTAGVVSGASDRSDAPAVAAIERYLERFGRALATLIDIVDPDAIVLGGGLSHMDILYEQGPKYIEKYIFSDSVLTPLLRNRFGDSSGVRGAAWLW
jgi:fructokinase